MTKTYLFKKGTMQMGPFPLEKMRALARQGQIGRSYLISADGGVSWDNGSVFSEIFAADQNEGGIILSGTKTGQPVRPPTDPEWYYCSSDGEQKGPVAESQLRQLIDVGAVVASDTVWTEVLGDKWVCASEVPKFAALFPQPSTPAPIVVDSPPVINPGGITLNGGPGTVFCRECGYRINRRAIVCPQCGVPTEQSQDSHSPSSGSKNKTVAAVLALCLGGIGAHHFYVGNIGIGVLYLLFCWTLIPTIVSLIEGIMFLSMTDRAFDAKYNR